MEWQRLARKRYSDEDALKILREIDVHLYDGLDVVSACRKAGISDKTYYDWRKKFGGLGWPQLSQIRALKKESERLKKILRQELLNTEWFHSVKQHQVAINIWLKEYNHIRPHHALGMQPPVPETLLEKREIYGTEIGG